MIDLTAVGLRARLVAVPSYPAGFDITQFTDDTDPVDAPDITLASAAASLNGDLVSNKVPVFHTVTLNVLPNTDECANLDRLADVNRVGKNKVAISDVITLTITYPDGKTRVCANGVITGAPSPVTSATAEGRQKSRAYTFAFESIV